MFYCPMCGTKMKEMSEEERDDWGLLGGTIDGEDKADYYFCDQCEFPRTFHHPFNGVTSEAGDSWSMSFIK